MGVLTRTPLHAIASKKAYFLWGDEAQQAYDEILQLLVKPPSLAMPNSTGKFVLYTDTSKIGVGASLWQIQNNQERVIAYFSKSLPAAAANYSITELELTGLYIAVTAFRYLLKCTNFDVVTYHAAIPQMLRSKMNQPRSA